MVQEPDIAVIEAVIGSDLYRQALRLREAVLREPLGLTITEEELADDATRQHFCAISYGVVIGSVSLKPLDETTLQLKQMAVAEDRRRERIGARLFPDGAECSHGRRGLLCAVRLPSPRRAVR
jgi:predicted N-acetyltransferase YhbS